MEMVIGRYKSKANEIQRVTADILHFMTYMKGMKEVSIPRETN